MVKCSCGRDHFATCNRCGASLCILHALPDWEKWEKEKSLTLKWICSACKSQNISKEADRERAETVQYQSRCEGCDD